MNSKRGFCPVFCGKSKLTMNIFELQIKNNPIRLLVACIGFMLAFVQVNVFADESVAKKNGKEISTALDKNSNYILAKTPSGIVITVADILSEVNRMPQNVRPEFLKRPENIHQVVSNLLVRRILAVQAKNEQLDQDHVIEAAMAVARDRILSDARLNKMDKQNEPSDAAMLAYSQSIFKANIEKYETPAQTRASHILLDKTDNSALKLADDILAKIKSGAKFEDLAKEYSKDPGSAQRGGDLGFFTEGRMVKPFEEALNKLTQPGEISSPVESQFGFHIIRLDERKPKVTPEFDQVKDKLLSEARAGILTEKRMAEIQKITAQIAFEKESIVKFSKETSESLTSK